MDQSMAMVPSGDAGPDPDDLNWALAKEILEEMKRWPQITVFELMGEYDLDYDETIALINAAGKLYKLEQGRA